MKNMDQLDETTKQYIADFIEWHFIAIKEGKKYYKAFRRSDNNSPFEIVSETVLVQPKENPTLLSINDLKKDYKCLFNYGTALQAHTGTTQSDITHNPPVSMSETSMLEGTPPASTTQFLNVKFSLYPIPHPPPMELKISCLQKDFGDFIVKNTTNIPIYYKNDGLVYVFRNDTNNKEYPYVFIDGSNSFIVFTNQVKCNKDAKMLYNKYTPAYRPIAEILESDRN